MKLAKLLIALATATVALAACTTAASANHLSSSTQAFSTHWTNAEFIGGFGTLRCSLTYEGSFHARSINKTPELLIGFIVRASVGPCPATVLQATLPWHIRYAGFAGDLPTIRSITTRIIGLAFQIQEPTFRITCLFVSTVSSPATESYNLTAGSVTSVTFGGVSMPCGSLTARLGGTSSSNTAQTITLI